MKDESALQAMERVLEELRREARRAFEAPPGEVPETTPALLLCSGQARYALFAAQAREVARLAEIVPLPGAPPHLAGVTSVRGQVVPVLDLRRLTEVVPSERGPRARIVTLRTRHAVAVLVEAVEDLVEVGPGDRLDPVAPAGGPVTPPTLGAIRLPDGSSAALLDVERLVELGSGAVEGGPLP